MILSALQVTACLALAFMAIRWRCTNSPQANAYRFLFPYTAAAGVLGLVLVFPFAMELFVAHYSGALFEMEVMSYRLNGHYWWVFCMGAILPLLPLLGMTPFIGRRPLLVAGIASAAATPVLFWTVGGFF
jgi:hypothetical protein